MSACLGIPTRKVDAYTFAFGSGLAGIAGWALTLVGNVEPGLGQNYIVDSFMVVVTGGVGKLAGTIVASMGIGGLNKLLEPSFGAVYGKVCILVLVILFLAVEAGRVICDQGPKCGCITGIETVDFETAYVCLTKNHPGKPATLVWVSGSLASCSRCSCRC